jgi:hypothetical protein
MPGEQTTDFFQNLDVASGLTCLSVSQARHPGDSNPRVELQQSFNGRACRRLELRRDLRPRWDNRCSRLRSASHRDRSTGYAGRVPNPGVLGGSVSVDVHRHRPVEWALCDPNRWIDRGELGYVRADAQARGRRGPVGFAIVELRIVRTSPRPTAEKEDWEASGQTPHVPPIRFHCQVTSTSLRSRDAVPRSSFSQWSAMSAPPGRQGWC